MNFGFSEEQDLLRQEVRKFLDAHCPLIEVRNAMPAYTVAQAYRGDALNRRWSCPDKRSAFLAEFER